MSGVVMLIGSAVSEAGFFYVEASPSLPLPAYVGAVSVILSLSMLPVALALRHVYREDARGLSRLAMIIGVSGMLAKTGLMVLVASGLLPVEEMPTAGFILFTAGGAVGVWLLVTGYLALTRGKLPGALGWLGIVAGAGLVLLMLPPWLVVMRLEEHIPFGLFGYALEISSVAYMFWAVWLGRRLLEGTLT